MMNNPDLNSTERFSSRVQDYAKYRPGYPMQIISLLREQIRLTSAWKIADIGCGTGISSRMFIENGNEVFGVEPNDAMRQAAVEEFAAQQRFKPVKGTDQATTLPEQSVDLVVVAQAFHWFDRAGSAREFRRILRPDHGGWVLLMWNQRITSDSDFAAAYDALLLKRCPEYTQVSQRWTVSPKDLVKTFGIEFERMAMPNQQQFDLAGLNGRAASSSYVPQADQPGHREFYSDLAKLFDRFQQDGKVTFSYETELYLGRLLDSK